MRKFSHAATLAVFFVAVAPAVSTQAADAPGDTQKLGEARAAVKDLGQALKAKLVAQIKAGGVASAIPVCNSIAPALAASVSEAHNLTVGRTALKVRNPKNAPDAFEKRVLEDFVAKIAAGADPATLDYSKIVATGGKRVFRYMKAIPTAATPCLACHGSNIKDGVKAEIDKLYPQDQATGFKAGDLRGAFSVTITE